METAVAHLQDNPRTDCDSLGQLYLDCVWLLKAKGEDGRAEELRKQALATLDELAAGIQDQEKRRAFLSGIAAHRQLRQMTG
jgi:hypothetical protein